MSKSEVSITIPDEMIKGVVMAEMVKALGNKEELIRSVVASAFTAPAPNSYGRETIFGKAVQESITTMATTAFKEWLAENMEMVRKAVRKELDRRRADIVEQLAKAMVDGRVNVETTFGLKIGQGRDY